MYRKCRCKRPMNLQFFAEPAGGAGGGSGEDVTQPAGTAAPGSAAGKESQPIDYQKIQQMLDGTLAAKEDTALKAYFRQQGLSEEEMKQAVAAYKAEKAKNQPDVNGMQTQLAQAQEAARQAQIDKAATLAAIGMGLDSKTIPYVLKMADFSQVAGEDGKPNDEAMAKALNKVLEDIPVLKPQKAGGSGFLQIGAASGDQKGSATDQELDNIFGVKK